MKSLKRWFSSSSTEEVKVEPFKSKYPIYDGKISNAIIEKCKTFASCNVDLESIYRRLVRLVYVSLYENDGDDSSFFITITRHDIVKNDNEFNFHVTVTAKQSSLKMNLTDLLCHLDAIYPNLSLLQICNESNKPADELHFIFLLDISKPLSTVEFKKRPKFHGLYVFPPPAQILKECEKSNDGKVLENWKKLMGAIEHFFITSYECSFEMVLEQSSISETVTERRFYFVLKIIGENVCVDMVALYREIHYSCLLHNLILYFGPLGESRKNYFRFAVLESIKQMEKENKKVEE